jgi:putative transposase
VSASTAVKWVQRKRETGSVEAKPMYGHPPAKLAPHKDRLLRLVADEQDLTLRQIGERLAADGIHVSRSCLHTFLWRNRIRLKKDRARGRAEPAGCEEAA